MGATGIQWTDVVWNPTTGCRRVSPGCGGPGPHGGCYAEETAKRFWATQYPPNEDGSPRRFTDVRTHADRLEQPLHWRKPRRVFVNSMSDLFHEDVPTEFIVRVFDVMRDARQHTFQVLTKRPLRMQACVAGYYLANGVLPNVWLGVSVEDQERADERIPLLLDTPAAVRFISAEPLLGPVEIAPWVGWRGLARGALGKAVASMGPDGISRSYGLSWVIVGGESGAKARPMDLAWARALVEQCRAAGCACFVKQLGRRPVVVAEPSDEEVYDTVVLGAPPVIRTVTVTGITHSHAGDPSEWPEDLRVREFPAFTHA